MKYQLTAGYVLDPIIELMKESLEGTSEMVFQILKRLSYFDVEHTVVNNTTTISPEIKSIVSTYYNFISRGLPTRMSPYLCEAYNNIFDFIEKREDRLGGFAYHFLPNENNLSKTLRNCCLVNPNLNTQSLEASRTLENPLGSEFEARFLYEIVPTVFGDYLVQLLETQKDINDLIDFNLNHYRDMEELIDRPIEDFARQRIDFSIEFPFVINGKKGVVIEIDGQQHRERAQQYLDNLRDDALNKVGWLTIRLKTTEFHNAAAVLAPLHDYLNHSYYARIKEKFDNNFTQDFLQIEESAFYGSPFVIARIQKVLLRQMLDGNLDLNAEVWKIGIVERDIPGAHLALEDFKNTFEKLGTLAGIDQILPTIELHIFANDEFSNNEIASYFGYNINSINESNNFEGDILIDISLLERSGFSNYTTNAIVNQSITIRSSHSINCYPKFVSAHLINYQSQWGSETEETNFESALTYFLQYFFRKQAFRDGQLPIIKKALSGTSVIGLLPTGGGKSLTYQICALLQPGTAIVIDPIKSLMKDQYMGLLNNFIDAAVFINSSLRTQIERDIAERMLMNAEVLFAFVSPERLQINKFRSQLNVMHFEKGNYFNYCVVDEAHCVSEWGHDFRTSYLRLGENARNHCKVLGAETIPIFGLTATASFDVLSDVKRELELEEKDVVRRQSARRPELFFSIYQSNTNLNGAKKEFEIKQAIGLGKQKKLLELMTELPNQIGFIGSDDLMPYEFDTKTFYNLNDRNKYAHSILVFSPFKSENVNIGVRAVAPVLEQSVPNAKVGTFYGADDMNDEGTLSERNQDAFINNKLNVLVATKAFGMGIDKPNIRATVHLNFPSSIESFVQESGRAGRDGKAALCSVIVSDQEGADRAVPEMFHSTNFKGKEKEFAILNEILREITFPIQNQNNLLSEHIFNITGFYVRFNYWPRNNPSRIYINTGFNQGFGYVDAHNLNTVIHNANHPIDDCERVLNAASEFISTNCPNNVFSITWLKQVVEHQPLPGIAKLLDRINIGDELDNVVIGFRNNRITKIKDLLVYEVDERYTEHMVSKAAEYALDIDAFIRSLKYHFFQIIGTWPNGDFDYCAAELNTLFNEIRNENDTYKAIYRLSLIGVIDDYVVDYNTKTLNLIISKKRGQDYISSLRNYYLRYESSSKVKKRIQQLSNYSGNTIQKCLASLIDFVYESISSKRFSAIGSMEEACQIGLRSSGSEMKRFIELYFNSNYLEPLNGQTDNGKEFTPEIVWFFIEDTQGSIDKLEHLRGSTTRLLNDQPNNGALLLLRAFSVFLLETDEIFIERAQEDFFNGILAFEEAGYEVDSIYKTFVNYVNDLNEEKTYLVSEAMQFLELKSITKWVVDFNNKFYNNEHQTTS